MPGKRAVRTKGGAVLRLEYAAAARPLDCVVAVIRAVRVDEQLLASPIAARDVDPRRILFSGYRPTFIFTRGIPSATQPASCSAGRSSE